MLLSDRLLEPGALSVLFQPIVRLEKDGAQLHALECLTRGPEDSNAASADVMFEYARRKRIEPRMDRACIAAAFAAAAPLDAGAPLSVNVSARTLGRDPAFPAFLVDAASGAGLDPRRLTVEIVEHSPCWEGPSFAHALRELRAAGIRIAIDDVGLGYSNYRTILDAGADYLKVDRYFVLGVHADLRRRIVLASIAGLASALGGAAIAEGVETVADLAVVRDVGITIIQGYLFGAPQTPAQLAATGWTGPGARIPRPVALPRNAA